MLQPTASDSLVDDFTSEHHVYEPYKAGLPPVRPYLRELWKRREFALELSRTRMRAQHFDTAFGKLWLLLNPILLTFVYFMLVDILRGGSQGSGFFAHLMAGLFAFQVIQVSVRGGVRAVTSGGRLILNTAFPRVLLPLSSVVTAVKRFVPTILVYIPVHIIAGLPVGPHLLWVIPLAVMLTVMATGLTMLVAAAQVYFRDLKNILPYALRIWLYASPVLYYADEVPDRYDFLLSINPLGAILTAWSDVINQGHAPDPLSLAIGAAWSIAIFIAGAVFFISREREFAVRL